MEQTAKKFTCTLQGMFLLYKNQTGQGKPNPQKIQRLYNTVQSLN